MPATRARNGRFTSVRVGALPPEQQRLAHSGPVRRRDQSLPRQNGRFSRAAAQEHDTGTNPPDPTATDTIILHLAVDLSRSLASTRIPPDAFCLLADLLDFIPLHANGLPGPDVQRMGHLFKGDRVADAAYLKYSAAQHLPYQRFFAGGLTGRKRVNEARDAIAAFRKVRRSLRATS